MFYRNILVLASENNVVGYKIFAQVYKEISCILYVIIF